MPVWAWVTTVVLAVLALSGAAYGAMVGWRAYTRKALLRLLVRAEAVEAAARAMFAAAGRIAEASDEEIEQFADDPNSLERRTMDEIASRSALLRDELDRTPMPKRLVPVAEALADAAYLINQQASCVTPAQSGESAIEALSCIYLPRLRAYSEKARLLVNGACEVCGLDETAVYGGGLYL